MIDLRSHILDGTLCGPDSFAESLDMCRAAAAEGVETIVATPRWEADSTEPPLPIEECLRKLGRLEGELGGALSIKLGFALQFSPALPELVGRYGSQLALAGKNHLLVSLPAVQVPADVEEVWKSMSEAGFSVVVSHPECNTVLRRDAHRLARWVAEGLMLQIDAASVAGTHGREVRRFSLECLRKYEGQCVVASNMRRSAGHKTLLGSIREELAGSIGARQTLKLMKETPAAVIEGVVRRNKGRGFPSNSLSSLLRSIRPSKVATSEP